MELPTLPEILAGLAKNAIEVQKLWNHAHKFEIETFRFPAAVEPWAHSLLQGMAPSRLAIKEFQIDASIMLTTSFRETFELKAVPLNLAYSVFHGTDHTRHTRISINVVQCSPANSTSPMPNGGNHGR